MKSKKSNVGVGTLYGLLSLTIKFLVVWRKNEQKSKRDPQSTWWWPHIWPNLFLCLCLHMMLATKFLTNQPLVQVGWLGGWKKVSGIEEKSGYMVFRNLLRQPHGICFKLTARIMKSVSPDFNLKIFECQYNDKLFMIFDIFHFKYSIIALSFWHGSPTATWFWFLPSAA